MARFSDDKLEEIRNRADIVEVVGAQVRLRRAGRNYVGLCPFHNEKTPSFSVNPERGFFHCFGCGAGGTVFNFVMRTEGLTFPEAVESLARRCGVTLPASGGEAGPARSEREAALRANEVAAKFFEHVLWNTPEGSPAREYLGRRGVAADTARTFMLGFAPDRQANLAGALERRGLLKAAASLGLVRQDGGGTRDMFRGRLMFPIRDTQGRVIAFGGRVLDQRLPKYMNSPESPLYSKARNVYGLYEARAAIAKADRAIVVEGYLDAIAVAQAGFKETVASLGTALTVEQLRLLGRHTRNVLACFDGDEAGRKASLRALEVFLAAGMLGRGVFIPAGFDPDTFVKDRGSAAFGELLETAKLLVDYYIAEQAARAGVSIDARSRAAAETAELLRLVQDGFQFDLLARKAAEALGVSEERLRGQARRPARTAYVDRARGTGETQRDTALQTQAAGAGAGTAEIGLLAVALLHPPLRAEIAAHVEMFEDAAAAETLTEICASDEAPAALEVNVLERLGEARSGRLSALAVGPLLETAEQARVLARDYAEALMRRVRQRALEASRLAARSAASTDEAAAAAQELIALRRRGG